MGRKLNQTHPKRHQLEWLQRERKHIVLRNDGGIALLQKIYAAGR